MAAPSVSVVMPVRNYERYITEALASIKAQHYQPLETIVVDDGSSDASAEIAREFGARVIVTEHGGVGRARNLGVGAARGDLVAFLDADDVWTKNSLVERVEYLDSHPEIDIAFGRLRGFLDRQRPPTISLPARLFREQPGFMMSTLLIRREAFAQTGPFDETLPVGEDVDWLTRAQDAGVRVGHADSLVTLRRMHDTSTMVGNMELHGPTLTRVLKASLDRRRLRA